MRDNQTREQERQTFSQSTTSWFGWLKWENAPQIATAFFCFVGACFVVKEMSGLPSEAALQDDISVEFETSSTSLALSTSEAVNPAMNTQAFSATSPASRHLLSNPIVVNPTVDVTMTGGRTPVVKTFNATGIFRDPEEPLDPLVTIQSVGGGLPSFMSVSSSLNPSGSLPNPANNPYGSGNFVTAHAGTDVRVFDLSDPSAPVVQDTYPNSQTVFDTAISGSEIAVAEDNAIAGNGFLKIGPLGGSLAFIKRLNFPAAAIVPNQILFNGATEVAYLADTSTFYSYDVSGSGCPGSPCAAMIQANLPGGTTVLDMDYDAMGGYVWTAGNIITRIDPADTMVYAETTPPGAPAVGITATDSPGTGTVKQVQVVTGTTYLEYDDNTGIISGLSVVGSVPLPVSAGAPVDLTMVDNYAVVACANEMVVIDRSNRAAPSIFATTPTTSAQGIAAAGTNVALTKGGSGVDVYDFGGEFTTDLTISPAVGDTGVYPMEAIATNSIGENTTDPFTVTVLPETAPVANPISDKVFEEGAAQQLQLSNPFTDVNGDTVTVTSVTEAGTNQQPPWILGNYPTFLVFPGSNNIGTTTMNVTGVDNSPYTLEGWTTFQISVGYKPEKNPAVELPTEFESNGGPQNREFPSNVLLVGNAVDPTMTYEILSSGGGNLPPWLSANSRNLSFDPTKLPLNATTAKASLIIRGTTPLPLSGETEPFSVSAKETEVEQETLESVRDAVDKLSVKVVESFSETRKVVPDAMRPEPASAEMTLSLEGAPGWVSMNVVKIGDEQNAIFSGTPPRTAAAFFGPFREATYSFNVKGELASNSVPKRTRVDVGVTGTSYYMIALYVLLALRVGPLIVKNLVSFAYNRWQQRTPPENIGQLTRFTLDRPVSAVEAFDYEELDDTKRCRWFFTGRTKRAAGMPYGVTVVPSNDGKGIIGIERSGVAELQQIGARMSQLKRKDELTTEEEGELSWLKRRHNDKIAELGFNLSATNASSRRSTSYVFTRVRGIWPFRCKLISHEVLEPGNAEEERLLPVTIDEGRENPTFNDSLNGFGSTSIEMDAMGAGQGIYSEGAATHSLFASSAGTEAANAHPMEEGFQEPCYV